MQDYKIIGISDVVLGFYISLHKMVKLVHVDIHQKLASEIPKRQANVGVTCSMETPHYLAQQQNSISASDMFLQYVAKSLVVDISKKFSDVVF
jgi:hypothetical protein